MAQDELPIYEGPLHPAASAEAPVKREVSESEVPDGTVLEVEQWVSEDKARATVALKVEQAKGESARSTLVHTLERLVETLDKG